MISSESTYSSRTSDEFLNRSAAELEPTQDPLVPPVSAQELADWLRQDDDTDPILNSILRMATGQVINYIGYELNPRSYTVRYWEWPTGGTMTYPSLSPSGGYYRREINLPKAQIISVESVKVRGELNTDFTQRRDSIVFGSGAPFAIDYDRQTPALEVEYTAGFDPVPEPLKEAVLMLAAYLHMHRGCDAGDALQKSGVAQQLTPWRSVGSML